MGGHEFDSSSGDKANSKRQIPQESQQDMVTDWLWGREANSSLIEINEIH